MSEPKLPEEIAPLTREEAINLIISSIAMEEIGLSHIINSEGEKLQYALGTLEGAAKLNEPITTKELLELNKSIRMTMEGAMKNQMILGSKLQSVLNTPTMQGPTGATGAVGTILGSYNSVQELESAHPSGKQGDAYLVAGDLYVWDTKNDEWKNVGSLVGPEGKQGPSGPRGIDGEVGPIGPRGEQGRQGDAGTVGTIKGSYESEQELRAAHPDGGQAGDFYYVNPDLFVWDDDNDDWIKVGPIAGPQGLQGLQGMQGVRGEQGATGAVGVILGSYDSYEDLIREQPVGNQGDAYLIGGDLYVWNVDSGSWDKVGNLQGPAGKLEPWQELFDVSAQSEKSEIVAGGNLEFKSDTLEVTLESGPSIRIEKPYSAGTVIPYCSGEILTFTTSATGTALRRIIMNRGNSVVLNSTSAQINTAGIHEFAFPMPANGTVTAMSVYFALTTNTGIIWPGAATQLTARLYVSPYPSNYIFSPIADAALSFVIPFTAAIGEIYQYSAEMDIPLSPMDRVLLVVYTETAPSYNAGTTIGGRLSASVRIE